MRFCGKVGYAITEETSPGVWTPTIVERTYRGDVVNNRSHWETVSDQVNDDINIKSDISILADAFAYQNFSCIKYVEFMGAKWKVTTITPERPRITLTLGGLYNEQQD